MRSGRQEAGSDGPVELYHATSGRFVGSLSIAVIAGIVVYVVAAEHSVAGLRLGTGALFFGVLVWLTQLRPCAMASPDVLRLQNSVRDVDVPLALVDDVHMGRMLSVWVGSDRFVCVGIGAPLRTMVRRKGPGGSSLLGWDRLGQDSRNARPPRPPESEMSYPAYVESRIVTLAEEARRRAGTSSRPGEQHPRKLWAWPGITALAVTGAAFVVSLLL